MSDGELVRQVLAGEIGAYAALARRWAPRVMAVCHARTRRADAAEDLSQETLLRGLRALPSLSDPEKFGSWLCGIAVRACLDWLKASARSEVSLSALADGDEAEATEAGGLERREEIRRLMSEVERLPATYRQALMRFYYDDCTYKELAAELGVSVATINSRLTKARQLLRERLGGRESPAPVMENHDALRRGD